MDIELEIKAEDIESTEYVDARDCAITRALARAGHPELIDVGKYIAGVLDREKINFWNYPQLAKKVSYMYQGCLKVEDFTYILRR